MTIVVPTEVVFYSLIYDVSNMTAYESHVVLETVLADVLHELLEIVNLCNCDTSVHCVWIVCDLSFSEVRLDAALRIVGRDTEECEVTFCNLSADSTECVNLTECTSEYSERCKADVVLDE